jgi:phosphonate transport system ATP-binding protein
LRSISMRHGKIVYDGPSAALTPALLKRLYGEDVRDLLDEEPSGSVAVVQQPDELAPQPQPQVQPFPFGLDPVHST